MKVYLGLERWPLAIPPTEQMDDFGFDRFHVVKTAARCRDGLVPDVETHRLERVPPRVAMVTGFAVS
jgi:hypothetical protein